MSGAATSPSVLRLVNADAVPASRSRHAPVSADRVVRAENVAASRLDGTDARWVLAVRATMALEGGRAAILRPDDRRTLVSLAESLGLRPFDAALIIAIAQDAARCGEALSGPPQDRLAMVHAPVAQSDGSLGVGSLILVSCLLGALFFSILRVWLLG